MKLLSFGFQPQEFLAEWLESLAGRGLAGGGMYRASPRGQLEFPNFYLPFAGRLDPENRWITLARLVPWELADEIYRESLCGDFGAPALLHRRLTRTSHKRQRLMRPRSLPKTTAN